MVVVCTAMYKGRAVTFTVYIPTSGLNARLSSVILFRPWSTTEYHVNQQNRSNESVAL